MTAREFDPACEDCNRLHMGVMWARGDLGDLRRKARSSRADQSVFDRLAAAKAEASEKEAAFEAHASDVHPDGFGSNQPARVEAWSKPVEPEPVPEGKAVCEVCGKAVRVVDGPRLARHKGKPGMACTNLRIPGAASLVVDLPPVVIPAERRAAGAKGECRECGKWLPGERSLCGRCSVLQGRAS